MSVRNQEQQSKHRQHLNSRLVPGVLAAPQALSALLNQLLTQLVRVVMPSARWARAACSRQQQQAGRG